MILKIAAAGKISERRRGSQNSLLQNRLEQDCGYIVSIYKGSKVCGVIFPNQIKHSKFKICCQVLEVDGFCYFGARLRSWPSKDLNRSLFGPVCLQPVNQTAVGGQALKQELDIVRYHQIPIVIDSSIRIWGNRELKLEK